MKKRGLICFALLLSLTFSACAKKSADFTGSASKDAASSQDLGIKSESKSDAAANGSVEAVQEVAKSDKKIITNSSLYIEEEDLINLSKSIQKKAEELGGYIEGEELSEYRLFVTARIPSKRFDEFINYTENGFHVKSKNVSSENITDAYVDNEARLNNLKAQEKQILEIMKKANTVEEVLKVQSELYKVRGEIEALEARKKSWDKQVDYATVKINADKKQIVQDNKKTIIGGSDFVKAIGKGFSNTTVSVILFFQNLIIFILSNIIVIVILALLGFILYKEVKKYYKKHGI